MNREYFCRWWVGNEVERGACGRHRGALVLNIVQFAYFTGQPKGTFQDDVPVTITEFYSGDVKQKIGQTATVDGYFCNRSGVGPMLVSDPQLLYQRQPLKNDSFVLLDSGAVGHMEPMARYHVKAIAQASQVPWTGLQLKYQQSALVQVAQGVIRPQHVINRATIVPSEMYGSKYALLISDGGDAKE